MTLKGGSPTLGRIKKGCNGWVTQMGVRKMKSVSVKVQKIEKIEECVAMNAG